MTRAVELAQVAALGVSQAFKNRIINGWMLIDQRNGGSAVSATNSGFAMDRWATTSYAGAPTTGKYTTQQVGGAAPATQGFTGCLRVISSAATAVGGSDIYAITQAIEGQNIQDLAWGSASARTITLSFWVQSSLTGNFGGALMNNDGNYNYPFQYTINVANTWEYKTITIPGPTAGTWLTNNGAGVYVRFGLGGGSAWSQPAGAWTTTTAYTANSSVNVVSTNGATWLITGVQFEVGSTATSFDYRPYGTEFMLCQRYYYKYVGASGNNYEMIGTGVATNATQADAGCPLPVPMRTVPSCAFTGTIFGYDQGNAQILSSIGAIYGGKSNIYLNLIFTNAGGFSAGRGFIFYTQNATTASFAFSAEL
jgi:hypothetical protein